MESGGQGSHSQVKDDTDNFGVVTARTKPSGPPSIVIHKKYKQVLEEVGNCEPDLFLIQ